MPIETFYISSAHTISNKLVIKVSAQKKGVKSYDSYKCVQILVVCGIVPKVIIFRYHIKKKKNSCHKTFLGRKADKRKKAYWYVLTRVHFIYEFFFPSLCNKVAL